MVVTIKRMTECTIQQCVHVWNEGFRDYLVPLHMTPQSFLARFVNEGLDPELSLVAFDGDEPVGFVMSGVRIIDGQKVAWNGGTGVVPSHRRQGVGKALMEATLAAYRREGVKLALLEAISENEKAIALYEQMGYGITDRLEILVHDGAFAAEPFGPVENGAYRLTRGLPRDVGVLPFYRHLAAWQTQWHSIKDGESLTVFDEGGQAVGYALYKRVFDPEGKQTMIVLHQCEAAPERADREAIMRFALAHVFAPSGIPCMTMNLPHANGLILDLLRQAGFTVKVQQVMMACPLSDEV